MRTKTVLIVEDYADARFICTMLLESQGYGVLQAENGKQGVDCAQEHHPDLILMDLQMPVLDGWEAMKRLKADPSTASIPVFVLSAHIGRHDAEQVDEAGFECCLTKPIAPKALMQAIQDRIGPPSEPQRRLACA